MKKFPKRKICFPITNRIHYARQKHLLDKLNRHPKIDLQLIVGGSIVLDKYGQQFLPEIKKSGFRVHDVLYNVIDGGNHVTMAKTAALTALEVANSLYKLNPDIVLIRGDRFEKLAIAMAAAYLNKTIAHIEGGDLSGTIDESVRHAITKLAHIHFTTNEPARERLIKMGEHPKYVFNVGSPDIEFAAQVKRKFDPKVISAVGTGADIDFKKPFVTVMCHPVTTDKNNRLHTEKLLQAIDELDIQTVWFWPNNDAGTAEIAKAIRVYRELGKLQNHKIRFVTDILPEDFIALLKISKVMVGNSSAGIKECSHLGVPAVNIGSRQEHRLRGPNVLDCGHDAAAIKKAVAQQLNHGPYPSSSLYYRRGTSDRIVKILSGIALFSQKHFYEI